MVASPNKADYYWGNVEVVLKDDDGNIVEGPFPISSLGPNNDYIDLRLWRWFEGDYYSDTSLMETYEGYWIKVRDNEDEPRAEGVSVFLRFNHYSQASNMSAPVRVWLAGKAKAIEWIRNVLPQAREAIADNDSPPMPMGLFEDSVDPVFEGCFVGTVGRD